MEEFHLYKDIKARTGGEIFLGVVGPVRTGKSTFVRHFMELLVLPNLKDQEKRIATDELPPFQTASLPKTRAFSPSAAVPPLSCRQRPSPENRHSPRDGLSTPSDPAVSEEQPLSAQIWVPP